jgi:hypothetical protein
VPLLTTYPDRLHSPTIGGVTSLANSLEILDWPLEFSSLPSTTVVYCYDTTNIADKTRIILI